MIETTLERLTVAIEKNNELLLQALTFRRALVPEEAATDAPAPTPAKEKTPAPIKKAKSEPAPAPLAVVNTDDEEEEEEEEPIEGDPGITVEDIKSLYREKSEAAKGSGDLAPFKAAWTVLREDFGIDKVGELTGAKIGQFLSELQKI
jgi:hypothetical protein